MSFEEEFPSMKGYSFMAIWDKDNMWNAVKASDVEQCCLDKQRVKKVIEKYEKDWESSDLDTHFNIEGLKEELGL